MAKEKPSNFGFPFAIPSEAMRRDSPTVKLACITFSPLPGGMPGGGASGLSFIRMSDSTFAPSAFL